MSFFKKYVPMEVWPLLAGVTTGVSLSFYAMHHHMNYNTDVNHKLSGAKHSWERFDAPSVSPHFHFLEGQKANERKGAFVQRQIAEGKM